MGLLDITTDAFQHWDIILNFLKKYIINRYSIIYYPIDLEGMNYKIYPPHSINKINNLVACFNVDYDRSEVEIYFNKPNQSMRAIGSWVNKENKKRLHCIHHKGEILTYNKLLNLIYEPIR